MAEFYAVVQWTSAKVTSMGIIAESECEQGEFEVGAQIQARYRSNVYDAKVLFIGDLDSMSKKLASLKSSYKPSSTDSPRGRGHRMVKKKVMEDFVQPDDILPKEKEEGDNFKSSSKTQNYLKRKATEDTGDAIIAKMLLCQRSDSLEDMTEDGVEDVNSKFEEAQLIATLRTELESCKDEITRLQLTITELKEQNHLLQKRLPDLTEQLLAAIASLGKAPLKPAHAIVLPATPSKPLAPKMQKTPVRSFSSPLSPSLHESPKESVNKENDFIIEEEILRRVSSAKSWGALVCNLMSALFKREEMATACLTAKQAAKAGKTALSSDKVDAIIKHVQKMHSNADVAAIRIKMSTKLRDERNAFNS